MTENDFLYQKYKNLMLKCIEDIIVSYLIYNHPFTKELLQETEYIKTVIDGFTPKMHNLRQTGIIYETYSCMWCIIMKRYQYGISSKLTPRK